MPRHRWFCRSGNGLPVYQDRLTVIKLVNKRAVVQQRIDPQRLVLALICEERDIGLAKGEPSIEI
jgi:hypothetical protein